MIRLLVALVFLCASTLAHAQEICAATPEGAAAIRKAMTEIQALSRPNATPVQGVWPLDEKLREFQEFPPKQQLTPWGTPGIPHLFGNGPSQRAEVPDEKRFSWYGYRHKELHAKVIPELLQKTVGKNCCNGVWSGECRITRYVTEGVGPRRVLIDDLNCEITDDTRIVQLDSFDEQDTIVVCAHRTHDQRRGETRSCPRTYCIGGGRMGG